MSRKVPDMPPERLADRPEWRGTLGRMSEERIDQARLDRGAARLRAALAAGAVGSGGALIAGGAKPGLAAAGAKGVGLLAAAAKIAVPLVIVAAAGSGAGIYWAKKSAEPPVPEVSTAVPAQTEVDGDEAEETEEAEDVSPAVEASPERPGPVHRHKRHAHKRTRSLTKETVERTAPPEQAAAEQAAAAAKPGPERETAGEGHLPLADAPERHVSAENKASDSPEPASPLWPKPDRSRAEEKVEPAKKAEAAKDEAPAKAGAASALDAQLRMFHAAEGDLKKDSPDRALQRLDRLEREHPETPLGPEIALLRTEALVKAGRSDDAIAFIQRTAEAKWPSAKKAELFRVLGDLYVSRHACGDAEHAYERAFKLGLRGERKARAETALHECAAKK